jgi:hypothetical protein
MENLHGKKIKMTRTELEKHIESLKTVNGGWTKADLASLGVSWPPKSGWKKKLLEKAKTND